MTKALNLSLDTLDVETSKAMVDLTPFGNLGRFLFLAALELYCKSTGNEEDIKTIQKYKSMAYQTSDKAWLKSNKAPDILYKYEMDSESLLLNDKYLRVWYRDYIKENTTISSEEKLLFVKSVNFMSKGKDIAQSGLSSLEKLAWAISQRMGELFNEAVHDVSNIKPGLIKAMFADLKELVQDLTGKKAIRLDAQVSEKAKKNKKLGVMYEQYRLQMKYIREYFDKVLKRETLAGPVPSDKLEKKFKDLGFEILFFPLASKGFDGLIGTIEGKLALYTSHGNLLFGGIHPESTIKVNPAYDNETDNTYYLQYVAPGAATATRVYTANYRNQADETKHQSTSDNLGNTDKWLSAWRRDLKSRDPMRQVPAVIAYILYMTGARVGSATESRSKTGKGTTYGISTLLTKHVRVTGTSIIIKYIGKKQVEQNHVLKIADDPYFKICAKVITSLKAGKKPDQLLFAFPRPTSKTGVIQEVNHAFFSKYMKSCGVQRIHGMRHVRGTKLADELLTAKTWKPSAAAKTIKAKQAEADKYIKEKILTKVGELLGHRSTAKDGTTKVLWNTCIKSYVNPSVIADWYREKNLEVPRWVPRKLEVD